MTNSIRQSFGDTLAKLAKNNKNISVKLDSKDDSMAAIMNKQMLYFMPAITIFVGITLPGGLTLYWLVLTLLTILQQFLVSKNSSGNGVIEGELVK